jgi:hypothetical protein
MSLTRNVSLAICGFGLITKPMNRDIFAILYIGPRTVLGHHVSSVVIVSTSPLIWTRCRQLGRIRTNVSLVVVAVNLHLDNLRIFQLLVYNWCDFYFHPYSRGIPLIFPDGSGNQRHNNLPVKRT